MTAGEHTLSWTYTKDISVSNGQDCAWLDNIVFPPTTIIENVEIVEEEIVSIYPNPNNGSFIVNLGDVQSDVTIYNTMGQIVYRAESMKGNINVDLENITSGLYFVNVRNQDVNMTKKMILEF